VDGLVAVGAGAVAAVLVIHDEEDVGAGGLAGLTLEKSRSEGGLEGGAAGKLGHWNEDIPIFLYNWNLAAA